MKQFFERIAYIFKFRILWICIAFGVLFSIIITHVFKLQIIKGSEYSEGLKVSIEKTMSVPGSRGRILDRNGKVLAYDELVYAVNVSDSGSYSSKKEKNQTVNSSILKTLELIKENGDSYQCDFGLDHNDNSGWFYTVSESARPGFIRDCFGVATIDELTDEQKNVSAEELASYLIENYQIESEGIPKEDLIELLYLRVNMTANSYSRYMSFTIANEVSNETMSAILEASDEIVGVTVDEKYVRRYNEAKYFSAIIGYTGTVSPEQLDELDTDYPEKKYDKNDIVGKSGVEEAFEKDLSGTKGERVVYLDTVGRITEVISETKAVAGKDVYLTIDTDLQKKLYEILENKITDIILEHLTEGSGKYSFNSDGSVNEIYIRMPEVYHALIRNDLVSLSSLNNPATELEKKVNDIFKKKMEEELKWLADEMNSAGTPYDKLEDSQQNYVTRAFDLLKEQDIFKSEEADAEDEIFAKWNEGEEVSFRKLLEHAIEKGWIDTSEFGTSQYSDLEDIYRSLVSYLLENLDTDRYFMLDVYETLIEAGDITGQQMCMLLYDQGYLKKDSGLYANLNAGVISAKGFIYEALRSKELTPGELGLQPSSGGAIITDPDNGQLLAMVSYPGYDNNRLSGTMDTQYYAKLQYNSSRPMYNWATQAKCAPGSIFKLCTAITALDMGVASAGTSVNCTGLYTDIHPSPKCWVYPSGHGYESMTGAIRDSCNVYFYTMGARIASGKSEVYDSEYGTDMLRTYAERLGLATKSGVEIEESEPRASDTSAIASAIGQGTASYSCINISRYVTTIVADGVCYNSNLILKVADRDGNAVYESKPVVANEMSDISQDTWDTVKTGMRMATSTYPAMKEIKDYGIACKTGTSQPSVYEPDNATYVSYAPYSDPEITLSVEIPFGYTSLYNTEIAANFYKYYFDEYKTSKDNEDAQETDSSEE